MPLKHSTETLLTILLGAVFLLTGFVIAFLPPLKEGFMVWGIAFAASLLYPLLLYPLLRSRRADNAFRFLHFLPALFLLAWFGLQMIPALPGVARAESAYRFGWSLPLVAIGFLLLIVFCLRVLRQRKLRVILLLLLFVPFAALAVLSEERGWNPMIASVLEDAASWKLPGRFWVASEPTAEQQSSEETWQMQQRRMERRGERLSSESDEAGSPASTPASSKRLRGSSRPAIAKNTPPPQLPPSGFGSEVMIPLMLAGYTSTVHLRAKRRNKC